jgi:2-C-methyl-D-erythritol 4-phosphate cytidylyltransferase
MRAVEPKVVAVILAGGVGTRMGLGIPKQFVPIAGRTSLEHTAAVFEACERIDEIVVMMEPNSVAYAETLLARNNFTKITAVLPGGTDRNATSLLALQTLEGDDTKVVFHDAVRPLIDPSIVVACVNALDLYEAVDTAIPSADTIIEVDDSNHIVAVPKRSTLRRGQTPQAFRLKTILGAYALAVKDPDFAATDDCTVVLRYLPHVPILVVPGDESNIKITHPIDVHLADKLFQLRHQAQTTAEAGDVADAVVIVFGGTSGIGQQICLQLAERGAVVEAHSRRTGVRVQDRLSVAAVLRDAHERFGRIDHVVLTAGMLTIGKLAELTDDDLRNDLSVNLLGAFVVAQESHEYLKRSRGSLLLFSSSSHTRGRANYSVYSATKAAIVNLTQALADEWADDGIRVNCVSPSRTATPMRQAAFGIEELDSLVQAAAVAAISVDALESKSTGQVFDVRLPKNDPFMTDAGAAALP